MPKGLVSLGVEIGQDEEAAYRTVTRSRPFQSPFMVEKHGNGERIPGALACRGLPPATSSEALQRPHPDRAQLCVVWHLLRKRGIEWDGYPLIRATMTGGR
jgi:hypothetical protein